MCNKDDKQRFKHTHIIKRYLHYNCIIQIMKSRTKSTREHTNIQYKSRKISDDQKTHHKTHQQQHDTRKYLLKTLTLLQQHFHIPKPQKTTHNSALSATIYNIMKEHFAHQSTNNLQHYSTFIQKQNNPHQINKSTASLVQVDSLQIKRRSNSTLDEYFKDKFGSPAKDEETIEKKLRLLKALKNSQELVSKGRKMQDKTRGDSKVFQDKKKDDMSRNQKEQYKKGK